MINKKKNSTWKIVKIKHDLVRAEVEIDASLLRRRLVLYQKSAKTPAKAVVYSEIKHKTQSISGNFINIKPNLGEKS